MNIRILHKDESIPMDLLLDADPNEEKVKAYIKTETVYVGEIDNQVVGIIVIGKTEALETLEILNVSIISSLHGKGLGKQLIQYVIRQATAAGKKKMLVGTGNSSIYQIAFYQKCGFEMVHIIPNYFIDHYPEPIMEHGIPCKHMIQFELAL